MPPTDVQLDEAERMNNQIDVFSKAFQGLTIACARCHDHKFDAISTADYYALTGYLRGSCRTELPLDPGLKIQRIVAEQTALRSGAAPLLAKLTPEAAPGTAFLAAYELVRAKLDADAKAAMPDAATLASAARERSLYAEQLAAWCRLLAAEPAAPQSATGFWSTLIRTPGSLPGLAHEARQTPPSPRTLPRGDRTLCRFLRRPAA